MRAQSKSNRSDAPSGVFSRAGRVALVAAGLMFAASSVLAAAASQLTAESAAVPTSVSVSRAGHTTYAAYFVTVKNTGTNTTNRVVYEGSTQVLSSAAQSTASTAPAIESTDPSCKPTASGSGFSCALGQMAGGASRSFLLMFQAPTAADANAVANARIQLNSVVSFCSNTTCGSTNNVTITTQAAYTDLITTDDRAIASSVQSAIPSFGGSFFTGVNNRTSATGLHTTKVDVPKNSPISSNAIEETNVTATDPFYCDSINPKYLCYGFASKITVNRADTGAKIYLTDSVLTMTLTQDVSTIKPGTKIANVRLFYQYDIVDEQTGLPIPGQPPLSQALVEIPACTAGLPAKNQPCVASRTVVPKNSPGAGNFIFEILGRDNGRVSW
jgi:hypothetical protein